MKLSMTWKEKMLFEATDGTDSVLMDAKPPIGTGKTLSPKQLCLAAICGCTGMDVASLMRKNKQEMKALRVDADAPIGEGYPAVFTEVRLDFHFEGAIDTAKAIEAVELSQSKYCGVSAMISKACPIFFQVHVNGNKVHEGKAKFEF